MVTILLKDTKELSLKQDSIIFQHENLVDNLKILVPQKYNDKELKYFTAYIQFEMITNNVITKELILCDELYKDMLEYKLPIDKDLSFGAGRLNITLKFRKKEYQGEKLYEYRMNSGSCFLDIQPSTDYNDYKFETDDTDKPSCDFESHYVIEF